LYGGEKNNIVLKPLNDSHLPLLYKWNADPEVVYWTDGGEDNGHSLDTDTVHKIYGGVSQNAFCFLIEADGVPIGECWLQEMNLQNVLNMYDYSTDVRRIDMMVGEKNYWNKGIGSQFIPVIIDFAFNTEQVNVLHCFCEDYNIRSRRIWEKNGFSLILKEELPQPQKGMYQYHFRLTRDEYFRNTELHQ
jgi:RimJ/RimL family protein N-acetyltransferase